MVEIKAVIEKYALQNAIRYEGKAQMGNVIAKVLGDHPELRSKAQEIKKEVQAIIKEVNQLSLDEQTKRLQKPCSTLFQIANI